MLNREKAIDDKLKCQQKRGAYPYEVFASRGNAELLKIEANKKARLQKIL